MRHFGLSWRNIISAIGWLKQFGSYTLATIWQCDSFTGKSVGMVPHITWGSSRISTAPTLFKLFHEIISDARQNHISRVSIRWETITNPRFADDIDGLAGREELADLGRYLEATIFRYFTKINAEKTKLMGNSGEPIRTPITVSGQ